MNIFLNLFYAILFIYHTLYPSAEHTESYGSPVRPLHIPLFTFRFISFFPSLICFLFFALQVSLFLFSFCFLLFCSSLSIFPFWFLTLALHFVMLLFVFTFWFYFWISDFDRMSAFHLLCPYKVKSAFDRHFCFMSRRTGQRLCLWTPLLRRFPFLAPQAVRVSNKIWGCVTS